MDIPELLSHISAPTRRNIFIAVVSGLLLCLGKKLLRRRKSGDGSGNVTINFNINIATEEELRKSIEKRRVSLSQEQEKKIESCFIPGVKELEKAKKLLLQYGQEAKAKYHLEEAIKFFICAADALPCYETFYNLASAFDDYCDYENAKENYQKAIQDDPSQPGAYNGLGIVYGKTGNYPKAKECFQQALVKAEKLTNKWEKLGWQTGALGNLGNVYCQTGQMEQALKQHQQALKIFREIGNKLEVANALGNLGNVYKDTGQMEQALKHQQQALKVFREIGYKLGEANALMNLGNVYLQTDQMKQALEHYQQALKIHRQIGNKWGEAKTLNNLGCVYRDTGQVKQAREHYLLARAIFQKIGAGPLVKQTDENLAKLPGG